MDPLYVHLLFNHLPVFAPALGAVVLLYALFSRSNQTLVASYILFVISAFGAAISQWSGEGAEEAVEGIKEISMYMIEEHEDFAIYTLVAHCILGFFALVGILITARRTSYSAGYARFVLLLSLAAFAATVYTGWLGGKIRHTEIHKKTSPVNTAGEHEEYHEQGEDD